MPVNSEAGAAKGKLILIVDDDESICELLEFMVVKEGFRCVTAADGEEGIHKVRELLPDLVILDLMLPRYGGFEVLREMQAGETAGIPIVVVTGRYTDRSTVEMIRHESNVMDFLEKPIKAPVLAMTLHKILKTNPPEMKASQGGGA